MAKTENKLLENILKETQYQRRLTLFIGVITLVLTLYLIAYSITSIALSCNAINSVSCFVSPLNNSGFPTAFGIFIIIMLIGYALLRKNLSETLKLLWKAAVVLALLVLIGHYLSVL